MGRDLRPKIKLERREGVRLGLKGAKNDSAKHPMIKRPYAPGQHGPSKKNKRLSGYGTRLREKQKAKKMYRLLERAFHNYFTKAGKQSGNTSENLLRLLETRLDNVVYRLGLAVSRDTARQLVTHGHITVNGKKVDIPSYEIKVGETIGPKKTFLVKKYWQELTPTLAKQEVPGWLSLDEKNIEGTVISLPQKDELNVPFDPTMIIEFYSR